MNVQGFRELYALEKKNKERARNLGFLQEGIILHPYLSWIEIFSFPEFFIQTGDCGRWFKYGIQVTHEVRYLDEKGNRISIEEFLEACSEEAQTHILFNLDFFNESSLSR